MNSSKRDLIAWRALRETSGLGTKRLCELAIRLKAEGRTAGSLIGSCVLELTELGLGRSLAEKAARSLSDPPANPVLPQDIIVLSPEDSRYPTERMNSDLPLPVILYAKGDISLLKGPAVGIAGSRSARPRALEFTSEITQWLASRDMTIVSGHAAGVDEVAHTAALRSGGSTLVVIPRGMAGFKPRESLTREVSGQRLFLSGFELDAEWTVYRAMERNAWIAALVDFVIVVSAGLRGGSWAQGNLCLKTGKMLFVPDFPKTIAEGNKKLIKQGALPLDPSNPASILEYQPKMAATSGESVQLRLFSG